MSKTTIRIMIDQNNGSTVELGSIESSAGRTAYTACKSIVKDPKRRATITIALLDWVMKLENWVDLQDKKKESE